MRKGDAKRQAILDVAEKLFYSKGYEATTVQECSGRTGNMQRKLLSSL